MAYSNSLKIGQDFSIFRQAGVGGRGHGTVRKSGSVLLHLHAISFIIYRRNFLIAKLSQ